MRRKARIIAGAITLHALALTTLRAYASGAVDLKIPKAMILVGKSIIRLDRTSARLSLVNIVLTIVMAALTVVQIVLAIHH
jgi:hypothetical protein